MKRVTRLRKVFSVLLLGACLAGNARVACANPQELVDASVLVAQALAYEHGEGVPRDPERAAELYCDAVRLGSSEAMYSLGWMYANGRGVARDDAYAATLFDMAVFSGHAEAAKARRLVGDYSGSVPECLKARAVERSFAARDTWDTQKYLASLPDHKKRMVELITTLAPRFSIEPRLALAIATTESNFDATATSPKNAMGVMQLIPETASRFNVKDSFDPVQNIKGGLAYLRWLLAYYQGNVALAVAGYNAGEGAVDRYRGVPPYKETQNYVKRILAFFPRTEHPFDAHVVSASPFLQTFKAVSR
ncbi:MAG: transglycosylase SLT domain-containing protein [Zoogloea sp.]|jgi:TPR repeat protein|uniref:transglycosylase SLT domain-containing protein n=1 Tax=Zoogloea oleivorans TaxID=1552750 RepID=UPI0027E9CE09|nr:transglycosylase SLT domain-containing protein [Zoogloea sp.]